MIGKGTIWSQCKTKLPQHSTQNMAPKCQTISSPSDAVADLFTVNRLLHIERCLVQKYTWVLTTEVYHAFLPSTLVVLEAASRLDERTFWYSLELDDIYPLRLFLNRLAFHWVGWQTYSVTWILLGINSISSGQISFSPKSPPLDVRPLMRSSLIHIVSSRCIWKRIKIFVPHSPVWMVVQIWTESLHMEPQRLAGWRAVKRLEGKTR